jgi:hypothetical protein
MQKGPMSVHLCLVSKLQIPYLRDGREVLLAFLCSRDVDHSVWEVLATCPGLTPQV